MNKHPPKDGAKAERLDNATKRPAKRCHIAEKLEVPEDLRFLWTDAWLLQAVYYASRDAPSRLSLAIGAADYINHAIMTYEEFSGGLARLSRAGLVIVDAQRWEVSRTDRVKSYLRSLEQHRAIHTLGREIERWLGASPDAPPKPVHQPSDDLRYPGLSEETFDAAVDEYLKNS